MSKTSKNVLPAKNSNKITDKKPFYEFVKRLFDIVFSLLALVILSPIFIILAIAVKADSKGPAFFRHKRVGKNGKTIYIYKFRSMVEDAEEVLKTLSPEMIEEYRRNYKIDNDPRITKVGKLLRKTSLDELPQLLNILKGELSFVGPRPITEEELTFFGNYDNMLLSVQPGLTGFWAVSGRNDVPYRRRRAMEIYYVKNRSFRLDAKILFKTITAVFEGI